MSQGHARCLDKQKVGEAGSPNPLTHPRHHRVSAAVGVCAGWWRVQRREHRHLGPRGRETQGMLLSGGGVWTVS